MLSNTNISHYRILSKLGAGGMGEVYLAEDTKLDRQVALKILPAEFAASPEHMRRFEQEAKAASALHHPNIIAIHEIDDSHSGHFIGTELIPANGPSCALRTRASIRFIATEFVEGETLRARMRRERVTVSAAVDVAVQVASALSAAHEAGIIHRDIKPANIIIGRDGIVKVLDFGIARVAPRPRATPVDSEAATKPIVKTEPGAVVGTAYYMSPEQARGLDVDARTDIWSLGCVLYQMVAGRRPFVGDTMLDVLVAVVNQEPDSLSRWTPDVPVTLERIVNRMLRKNRDQRYQTAKDLRTDLRALSMSMSSRLPRTVIPPT